MIIELKSKHRTVTKYAADWEHFRFLIKKFHRTFWVGDPHNGHAEKIISYRKIL